MLTTLSGHPKQNKIAWCKATVRCRKISRHCCPTAEFAVCVSVKSNEYYIASRYHFRVQPCFECNIRSRLPTTHLPVTGKCTSVCR